jgi:hypothetical protein
MKPTGLFAAAVTAALLAGCGGSAATPPAAPAPAAPSNGSSTQTQSGARASLAINLSTGTKTSSATQRSAKQITSDVTQLLVNFGGTATYYPLTGTGSPCTSPAAGSYSCVISEPVGTYSVYAGTAAGSTASHSDVGYAVAQSATLAVGQTTALNFVVTPIVSYPQGSISNQILPADGQTHTVSFQADLIAPNGGIISSPVDTLHLLGTMAVNVSVGGAHMSVTPPTQPAAAVSGSYNDAWSLTYDGAPVTNNYGQLAFVYTKNTSDGSDPAATLYTAAGATTNYTQVYFEDLELPQANAPSGATFGGNTFANGVYYIAPGSLANNGTAQIAFQNSTTTSTSIALIETSENGNPASIVTPATPPISGMTECPAGVASIGSSNTTANPGSYTTNVTINNTNGSAPCSVTFKNGTFSTLVQNVAVYPPASLTANVSSIRRN